MSQQCRSRLKVSRLEFGHRTFHLRSERFNGLRHRRNSNLHQRIYYNGYILTRQPSYLSIRYPRYKLSHSPLMTLPCIFIKRDSIGWSALIYQRNQLVVESPRQQSCNKLHQLAPRTDRQYSQSRTLLMQDRHAYSEWMEQEQKCHDTLHYICKALQVFYFSACLYPLSNQIAK